jgi:hypothetical protein
VILHCNHENGFDLLRAGIRIAQYSQEDKQAYPAETSYVRHKILTLATHVGTRFSLNQRTNALQTYRYQSPITGR